MTQVLSNFIQVLRAASIRVSTAESIDAASARVIVGPRAALATHTVRLRDLNWLGDGPLAVAAANGLDVAVRVRSTREPQPAVLRCDGDGVAVELAAGEFGVSPGQACVLYDGTDARARVLGGGTIVQPVLAGITAGPATSIGAPAPARRAVVAQS